MLGDANEDSFTFDPRASFDATPRAVLVTTELYNRIAELENEVALLRSALVEQEAVFVQSCRTTASSTMTGTLQSAWSVSALPAPQQQGQSSSSSYSARGVDLQKPTPPPHVTFGLTDMGVAGAQEPGMAAPAAATEGAQQQQQQQLLQAVQDSPHVPLMQVQEPSASVFDTPSPAIDPASEAPPASAPLDDTSVPSAFALATGSSLQRGTLSPCIADLLFQSFSRVKAATAHAAATNADLNHTLLVVTRGTQTQEVLRVGVVTQTAISAASVSGGVKWGVNFLFQPLAGRSVADRGIRHDEDRGGPPLAACIDDAAASAARVAAAAGSVAVLAPTKPSSAAEASPAATKGDVAIGSPRPPLRAGGSARISSIRSHS